MFIFKYNLLSDGLLQGSTEQLIKLTLASQIHSYIDHHRYSHPTPSHSSNSISQQSLPGDLSLSVLSIFIDNLFQQPSTLSHNYFSTYIAHMAFFYRLSSFAWLFQKHAVTSSPLFFLFFFFFFFFFFLHYNAHP